MSENPGLGDALKVCEKQSNAKEVRYKESNQNGVRFSGAALGPESNRPQHYKSYRIYFQAGIFTLLDCQSSVKAELRHLHLSGDNMPA
jgi:hypothetical protein